MAKVDNSQDMKMDDKLEAAVFRAPPKEFMAARTALHDALKTAGHTDEAKLVKTWRRPSVPVWLWNRLMLDQDEHADEALTEATAVANAIAKGASAAAELTTGIAALRAASADVVKSARKVAAYVDVGLTTAHERELVELVLALPWSAEFRELAARGRVLELPPAVDPLEAMRVSAAGAPAMVIAAPKPTHAPAPLVKQVDEHAAAKAAALAAKRQAAIAAAQATLDEAQAALATAQQAIITANREVQRISKLLQEAESAAKHAAVTAAARQRDVDAARTALAAAAD